MILEAGALEILHDPAALDQPLADGVAKNQHLAVRAPEVQKARPVAQMMARLLEIQRRQKRQAHAIRLRAGRRFLPRLLRSEIAQHRGNHEHDRHTGRKRGCGDPHETVVPMLRVHREPSAYRRGRIAP